jgi:hypothetical protein
MWAFFGPGAGKGAVIDKVDPSGSIEVGPAVRSVFKPTDRKCGEVLKMHSAGYKLQILFHAYSSYRPVLCLPAIKASPFSSYSLQCCRPRVKFSPPTGIRNRIFLCRFRPVVLACLPVRTREKYSRWGRLFRRETGAVRIHKVLLPKHAVGAVPQWASERKWGKNSVGLNKFFSSAFKASPP